MTTAEAIGAYFESFNAHEVERRLSLLHPEVRHDINQGGVEFGREAFAEFIRHMDERYEEQITELVVMENGSRGAAEFIVEGVYKRTDEPLPVATGQRYTIPAAAFFEVEGGLITRVTSYYNLQAWLAAIES